MSVGGELWSTLVALQSTYVERTLPLVSGAVWEKSILTLVGQTVLNCGRVPPEPRKGENDEQVCTPHRGDGNHLEYVAEAGPGDFIYVPPWVPHQEINANPNEPLECVLVRSGQEPVVVNLDIESVEPPEEVYWTDDIHSR